MLLDHLYLSLRADTKSFLLFPQILILLEGQSLFPLSCDEVSLERLAWEENQLKIPLVLAVETSST